MTAIHHTGYVGSSCAGGVVGGIGIHKPESKTGGGIRRQISDHVSSGGGPKPPTRHHDVGLKSFEHPLDTAHDMVANWWLIPLPGGWSISLIALVAILGVAVVLVSASVKGLALHTAR